MKKTLKKIYCIQLGCPKLEVDQEYMNGGLIRHGVDFVDSADEADAVIVSTCGFIDDARREAVDSILEAISWKEEDNKRQVFVTGCMAARYRDELISELPEVDGVFAFNEWNQALSMMSGQSFSVVHSTSGSIHPGKIPPDLEHELFTTRQQMDQSYAYVKIAEGCNRRCSYCAIPDIRGPYQSRPFADVIEEVDRILNQGIREVILIGQEINSYGKDLGGSVSIETLLEHVGAKIENEKGWLRLLYTHPPLFTDQFVRAISETPALVPYLDFPIEHADDSVLKVMGRGTTWKRMRHWIERLRESIPDIALRTSVIVGHPGEGTKEFENLLRRLEEVKFARLGVFRYSPEEGTRGFAMDAPSSEEAAIREDEIHSLIIDQADQWYESKIGQTVDIIIDSNGSGTDLVGRTVWDAPEIDGEVQLQGNYNTGTIIKSKLVDGEPYVFIAKPI